MKQSQPFFSTRSVRQKPLLVFFSLLCSIFHSSFFIPSAHAQQIGSWKVFAAYTTATYNLPVGNRIYSLMEDKLMAYDTEDASITTFDWLHQLSDVTISFINYSAEARRIIIIYDNGNIDLLSIDDDYDVINLAQLKNSSKQNKTVNFVQVSGENAYVCTDFGLVVVDMKNGIILDSYEIGLAVKSCALNEHSIYVGTATGLWYASRSANLKDKSVWKQFNTNYHAQHMEYFDGCIWAHVDTHLFVSNPEVTSFTELIPAMSVRPDFLTLSNGKLLYGSKNSLYFFSDKTNYKHISGTFSWTCLTFLNNIYWASDGSKGLQGYTLNDDGTLSVSTSEIHPNSPLHNYSLHFRQAGNRLMVAGGNWNYGDSNRNGTAMILEPDGTWLNFDSESVSETCPNERYLNVTYLAEDPNDPSHHYVGTARSGIFDFINGKCVGHIGLENSPLKSILPNSSNPQNTVSADGLIYDEEGNLWMLNCTEGAQDTTIRIMRPDGTWTGIPCDAIHDAPTVDKIIFDTRGWAWINSRRMTQRGILMLDYNNTIDRSSDDKYLLRSEIINQDGNTYSPNNFYDIAEDLDGSIWIATELGPFLIKDPENFRSSTFTFEQVKVARNDGSGLADYLFNGIPILSIAIDGAGRKWFGTLGNGVYLVSEDCQQQLAHFSTDNSPLPSDEVMDITIHPTTGNVFFATTKGLCCYTSDATTGADDLVSDEIYAYPNPVSSDYHGPIAVRGLVKDSEVKILSSTGQLVWSGTSKGGTFTWNGCNQFGQRVSSGVYILIANTPDGEKAVTTKIAFIK